MVGEEGKHVAEGIEEGLEEGVVESYTFVDPFRHILELDHDGIDCADSHSSREEAY